MPFPDAHATLFAFSHHNCLNISSPEDMAAGRKVYSGTVPARSVLELEDNENVREYLVAAKGKQKKSPTLGRVFPLHTERGLAA